MMAAAAAAPPAPPAPPAPRKQPARPPIEWTGSALAAAKGESWPTLWGRTHTRSNDAIFGLALGYRLNDYERFAGSLRRVGFTGDLVLAVDEKLNPLIEEYLKTAGAIVYPLYAKVTPTGAPLAENTKSIMFYCYSNVTHHPRPTAHRPPLNTQHPPPTHPPTAHCPLPATHPPNTAKCVGGKLKCHLSRWFTMTHDGEGTAEGGAEAAAALGQPYLPMAIIRHYLYLHWLQKYDDDSLIYIFDFRDTVFQSHPFRSIRATQSTPISGPATGRGAVGAVPTKGSASGVTSLDMDKVTH